MPPRRVSKRKAAQDPEKEAISLESEENDAEMAENKATVDADGTDEDASAAISDNMRDEAAEQEVKNEVDASDGVNASEACVEETFREPTEVEPEDEPGQKRVKLSDTDGGSIDVSSGDAIVDMGSGSVDESTGADNPSEGAAVVDELSSSSSGHEVDQTPKEVIAPSPLQEVMDIPVDKVGAVIGSKGSTIQTLQQKAGCRMHMNQNVPEGTLPQLLLSGTREQIELGKALTTQVMEDGSNALFATPTAGGAPFVTQIIDCPPQSVGRLIGRSGATIRDLQQRADARIVLNQDDPTPGVVRKVTITGAEERVAIAIQLCQYVMEHGAAALNNALATGGIPGVPANMVGGQPPMLAGVHGNMSGMGMPGGAVSQTVECPRQLVGRMIGKGGETINLIQTRSSCRVQIDQKGPDQHPAKVILTGPSPAVAIGMQIVNEIITNGTSRISSMPIIPPGTFGGAMPGGMSGMPGIPGGMSGMPGGMMGGMPGGMPVSMPGYGGLGGYANPYGQQQQQQHQPYSGHQGQYAGGYGRSPYGAPPPQISAPTWTEHSTPEGRKYWHNASTGVSTWDKPSA